MAIGATPDGETREKIKVFISYSRKDRVSVAPIFKALEANDDIDVFQDTEDILPTEEWRGRLEDLISAADTIVFCLSPDSAVSEVCAWEVEFAESLNKRIAPIVIRDVDGKVPKGLAKLNYIFFTQRDDFNSAIKNLITALNTDITWIREHTRLGELARRWAAHDKPRHGLLRGRAIDMAEQWASYRSSNAPELTLATQNYLTASRDEDTASRWRKRRSLAILGGLGVVLVLGGLGWWWQNELREQYQWRMVMEPSVLKSAQEQEHASKPGSEFAECKNGCPTMVTIPAGTFLMGSAEALGEKEEHPQHEVTIARPFAVSTYELTFAQWDACVTTGGCVPASDDGRGRGQRPVINVTWQNAKKYVAWLSRLTGKKYRLLSEAEWEYAARATDTRHFSFGNDDAMLVHFGWYAENALQTTHPVGEKGPNGFGLHDMHGNVSEWVEDCWTENYTGAPGDGQPWSAGNCNRRVFRGGAWLYDARRLRSAHRDWHVHDEKFDHIGFRIARSLN